MNVIEYYEKELAKHGYKADVAQQRAIKQLQYCYDDWIIYKARCSNVLKKWIIRPNLPRGLYMWGGVGRGKSFLMDIFYAVVPVQRKTRFHFHEFMREVHRELTNLKGYANPIDELARLVARRYQFICFDEFHISDIADAMILHLLLSKLFNNGVQFIMTSNYKPSTIYPDGLHRDRVLPTIDLIHEKLEVLNIDAGTDYRQCTTAQIQAYYTPLGIRADSLLHAAFTRLAKVQDNNAVFHFEKRRLKARLCANGVVWFDFSTLCAGQCSQNDYLELAACFHTIILSGVPQMTPYMASEARRYTWLIDILYDHKIKLLMSAAVPAEQLYIEGLMANEFTRTVSRIVEMQSQEYFKAPLRFCDRSLTRKSDAVII
ncbi:cell division protein ZapE [Candidatus Vallotiella sp. (ex Adelges kitamiensis)]|uniref:cell division protein ZapE n=1 Tax=Candidatus Vallotiella sp. (ex Adelges kitamiensis) TaxID=2864217 RepID=UPI001CE3043E|nr:cell division protein ZapE [Candidatus Vallotia sp. (ex Adelges kitamiensis)]